VAQHQDLKVVGGHHPVRASRAAGWSGTPRGRRASIAPGTASGESTGPKRTELPSDTNQQATGHVRVCAPFTLPALLQHRAAHWPLDQGTHTRSRPREGQAMAQEPLMRRHNSETGQVRDSNPFSSTAPFRVRCARCVPAASTGDRGLAAKLQVSRPMRDRERDPLKAVAPVRIRSGLPLLRIRTCSC
jgi:hypothetical protein